MASWFRSWHGAPTDNKWLVIARKSNTPPGIVSAVYWALLDCASQAEDRGNVSHFDIETYAAFSGFEEAAISSILDAFRDKGVIEEDRLTAWETRQPQREDVSTERVRKYRDKKNETQCNATKRSVTRGNNTDTEEIQSRRDPEESKKEEEGGNGKAPDGAARSVSVLTAPLPLAQAYPELCGLLRQCHPKAKYPAPGTDGEAEQKKALVDLVHLDKFSSKDVVDTLRWLFTADDHDAEFWRRQVHAWKPLRKTKDGMTKFARIHEAWKAAQTSKVEAKATGKIYPGWNDGPDVYPTIEETFFDVHGRKPYPGEAIYVDGNTEEVIYEPE